jgi:beta-lactam-binding protein with PASTA domain
MAQRHGASAPRGRIAGAIVVAALVVAGLMASIGAGYKVSHALLDDGSAYVAKGTTLAHVNGESGKADAQTPGNLANGKQALQVVKLPDGQVVVVNQTTQVATTVDGATMRPTATTAPAGPAATNGDGVVVVPSGRGGWLVNLPGGYVSRLGEHGPNSKQVRLGGPLTDAAPGPDGGVIALTRSGVVVRVGTDLVPHRMPISDGVRGSLTTAGGHTFLITRAGAVLRVDGDQPRTLTKPAGMSGTVQAGSVLGPGEHVLVVAHDRLLVISADSGATRQIALHSGSPALGRPVELAGRVYIPDYAAHRLLVANEDTGRLADPIKVQGTTATFALFVSGNRVWANDQFCKLMTEIDARGNDRSIDKGTGKGIEDPDAKAKKPAQNTPPHRGLPPPNGSIPQPGGPNPGGPARHPIVPTAGQRPPKLVTVPQFGSNIDYHDACARIERLGMRCTPVAVEADGRSGNTNDVVGTQPGAGSRVAVGDQVVVKYLGQLAVPDRLTGLNPDDACAAVTAAQLKCTAQAEPTPATSPQEFGIVDAVDPASGTELDSGSTVTVSYPDTFAMPDFTNQPGDQSCQQLQTYQLTVNNKTTTPKCSTAVGTTATSAGQAGKVYQQNPPSAAAVRAGDPITLTIYSGTVRVKDWTGADSATAVAECSATPGLTCTLADGDQPGGTPGNAGKVERQQPAPGDYPVVTAVTIVRYRSDNTVPNVTNMNKDAACAAIQSQGFVCAPAEGLVGPTKDLVVSQDQGAGSSAPLGSQVTYHYSPWQAEQISIYRANNGDPVWAMRFTSDGAPSGYGAQSNVVGLAYRPTGAIPSYSRINGYFCSGGTSRCEGYTNNHYYSRNSGPYSSGGFSWDGPNPVADFMGSCPAGSRPIVRYWIFSATTHQYGISDAVPPGASDHENLGCVW